MAEKPVALVTGVGPGTGAAIVRRFASDGFRVIALARSPDLTSVLERKLPDTHAVQCDVSEEGQVRETIAQIVSTARHGRSSPNCGRSEKSCEPSEPMFGGEEFCERAIGMGRHRRLSDERST